MTDMDLFRVYEPSECGPDGYPRAWHEVIKHQVRETGGHRCARCSHPYLVGSSAVWEDVPDAEMNAQPTHRLRALLNDSTLEIPRDGSITRRTLWSPCDEICTHGGPFRWRDPGERWEVTNDPLASVAQVWTLEPQYEIEASWRILTVHHLNEHKYDCRWWNLVPLCQRCHLYIQRKVDMNRVYPWEHSEWFKPYAAGWYALAYLGKDLTREEAEARQDELLALERLA